MRVLPLVRLCITYAPSVSDPYALSARLENDAFVPQRLAQLRAAMTGSPTKMVVLLLSACCTALRAVALVVALVVALLAEPRALVADVAA